jgi:cyclophilin family peptidyl-prolyl cis-trans isomerase
MTFKLLAVLAFLYVVYMYPLDGNFGLIQSASPAAAQQPEKRPRGDRLRSGAWRFLIAFVANGGKMKGARLSIICLLALRCSSLYAAQEAANPYNLRDGLYSEITTPKGVIVCELYFKKTPMTVANYVGLAEGTLGPEPRRPYFDGSPYHRVIPGFVLQGGGPPPERRGRLGYQFPDEFVPGLRHDAAGVLQMANARPSANGSQHCIMLGPSQRLNYLHTVFGRVVRGEDVPAKIEQGETMEKVRILRIGKEARAFKADEESFKALVAKAITNEGPHEPGPDAHFYDPDGVLPSNLNLTGKLSNFEKFTGQRINVRGIATTPAGAEGDNIDQYFSDLAEKTGVAKAGALVVYFGDQNKWHVRVAPDSAASFIAGPRDKDGKKPATAERKTLAEATQEFLAATVGPQEFQNESTSQPRRRRSRVEAVIDELIFRLEPAAPAVE